MGPDYSSNGVVVSASVAQLELGRVEVPRSESLDMRFSRWLGVHPKALRDFAEIADELVDAGERHLSSKFLIEIARYRQIIRRETGARYCLNNSFSSRLARALESTFPRFRGLFEARALADERGDA